MSIREVLTELAAVRAKHSHRSDHSAELEILWSHVNAGLDAANAKKQDPTRWLWIAQEVAALLEYRKREWEILDQLELLKKPNQSKIAKCRMRLLILWFTERRPELPKLEFNEFRNRAQALLLTTPMSEDLAVGRELLCKANLPHLLPTFRREESEERTKRWGETLDLAASEKNDALIALIHEILETRLAADATLIYAFLGSLHLHASDASAAALAYPAPYTCKPIGVPTPLAIIEQMSLEYSKEQLGEAFGYLTRQYLRDIFCHPYIQDEATKLKIVEQHYATLKEKRKVTSSQIVQYLRLETSRFDFWDFDDVRQAAMGQVRALAQNFEEADNPQWNGVMGIISLLDNRDEEANDFFLKEAQLRNAAPSFSKSAVTTFFPYQKLKIDELESGPYSCHAVQADLSALDRLEGDPDRGLVVTTADSKYFLIYGEAYVRSLRFVDPDVPLLFHIMDLNDKARELFSKLSQTYSKLYLSSETSVYPRPYYYATVRLLRVSDFVSRAKRPVFFTDIDTTFHTSTNHVFEYARNCDLILRVIDKARLVATKSAVRVVYPRTEPWDRVNASAMLFNATPVGLEVAAMASKMAAAFITKFSGQNATNWYIDQNVLYQFERWLATDGRARLGNFEEIRIPYGAFANFELSDPEKLGRWREEVLQPR